MWTVIFGIASPLYRLLQRRWFPWRYRTADIGFAALAVLAGYLMMTGAPPSLLRSYAMLLIGWLAVVSAMELLDFSLLAVAAAVLIVSFPTLLFSLGFWFSLAGVYYIFLLLECFREHNRWFKALLILPFGIFLLMTPLVHGVFSTLSPWQMLSPVLSLLFVPFYPVAMLIHIAGAGTLFDHVLLGLWSVPESIQEMVLPGWLPVLYIVVSLLAAKSRVACGLMFVISLITTAILYMRFI
jgi:competence protein ComEC